MHFLSDFLSVRAFTECMYIAERVLNPSFNDVLQFLPPDHSSATNKDLYRAFVRAFGTGVITSMTLGGAIELRSQFKTYLTDDGYTQEVLSKNIKNDFERGLWTTCGPSFTTPAAVDPTYTFVNSENSVGLLV